MPVITYFHGFGLKVLCAMFPQKAEKGGGFPLTPREEGKNGTLWRGSQLGEESG